MRFWAAPFLLMLVLLVVWPLSSIVKDSFYAGGVPSMANYWTIATDRYYLQSFGNAILLSTVSTIIGMTMGFLIAVALRQQSNTVATIVRAFANIGANLAGVPLAMALIFLFGLNGMFTLALKGLGLIDGFNVYTVTGLIIAYSYFQIMLAVLMISGALSAVTPDLEEAAKLLGVSRVRFWLRIGIPIVFWQMLAITILLLANAMGTFATVTALTGTSINLVSISIGELVSGDVFSDPNRANALAVLLFVVLLIPIIISQIAAARSGKKQ